jgi:hypothetical protein
LEWRQWGTIADLNKTAMEASELPTSLIASRGITIRSGYPGLNETNPTYLQCPPPFSVVLSATFDFVLHGIYRFQILHSNKPILRALRLQPSAPCLHPFFLGLVVYVHINATESSFTPHPTPNFHHFHFIPAPCHDNGSKHSKVYNILHVPLPTIYVILLAQLDQLQLLCGR